MRHARSCGEPVVSPEDEAMSYCYNSSCPAQLVRLLEHFVSRGAMDIEGMGIKWGEYLIRQGTDQGMSPTSTT